MRTAWPSSVRTIAAGVSLTGDVLVSMADVQKCVTFLEDPEFDAPCDVGHPLAWVLAGMWERGATNSQVRSLFDWVCRQVEEHEALTGGTMSPGDWGVCFCESGREGVFGDGTGRACAGSCFPSPVGSLLRADQEGRFRLVLGQVRIPLA